MVYDVDKIIESCSQGDFTVSAQTFIFSENAWCENCGKVDSYTSSSCMKGEERYPCTGRIFKTEREYIVSQRPKKVDILNKLVP